MTLDIMVAGIDKSWLELIDRESKKPYIQELIKFLEREYVEKKIAPRQEEILAALKLGLGQVKVVIVGQDPYHTEGMAQGLAFSVPKGSKLPPSLKNIYREIREDVGGKVVENGSLERWVQQGVLLLNTVLSVEIGKPQSHRGKGWERFTDAIIREVAERRVGAAFMLWGKEAKEKESLIDRENHLVLKAAHPSPLSARRGFFGCRHFSQANRYLRERGVAEIEW